LRAGHGASPDFTNFSSVARKDSELDIRYVAGLFDGEGWVRADPFIPKGRDWPRYQLVVGIGMTHRPIIEALYAEFGGMCSSYDGYAKRTPGARTIWRWGAASLIAYDFLRAVEPHLLVKRDQALLAMQLQEHITAHNLSIRSMAPEKKRELKEYRQKLHEELKRLKKVDYPSVDSDPMTAAA
jgi:hypothetical protein